MILTNYRPCIAETECEARASAPQGGAFKEAPDTLKWRREYRDYRLEWMIKSGGLSIVLDGLERNNIRFSVESIDCGPG